MRLWKEVWEWSVLQKCFLFVLLEGFPAWLQSFDSMVLLKMTGDVRNYYGQEGRKEYSTNFPKALDYHFPKDITIEKRVSCNQCVQKNTSLKGKWKFPKETHIHNEREERLAFNPKISGAISEANSSMYVFLEQKFRAKVRKKQKFMVHIWAIVRE